MGLCSRKMIWCSFGTCAQLLSILPRLAASAAGLSPCRPSQTTVIGIFRYPSEPTARTRVHEALHIYEHWIRPLLIESALAAKMGWATSGNTVGKLDELHTEALPRLTDLLERSGGPLLGGAVPSIADLVLGLALTLAHLKMPEFEFFTEPVVLYLRSLKIRLPCWAEYMAEQEVLYGGYRLQAQWQDGQAQIVFPADATGWQIVDKAAQLSGIPADDLAIKCGGGIRGCDPVPLIGHPESKLVLGT